MKIEFKRINAASLKKVFPVINYEDYSLIEGNSLIISDKDYEKIQKSGSFKVGPYEISKDLIQIAKGENYNPMQQDVLKEIEKKYVYSEKFVDIMFKGSQLEKNVLLFGRGGHAKSEMSLDILKLLKDNGTVTEEPFIMTCGDGLTEETLFGGINIKKFKDTGELEYLFKNSFLEHEVVIFEEIFDAPPQVLLALKDIMTSGWARKGNQKHKCKTKIFIGLTNRSKQDFAEDDSLEALMQRFPLTLKVEWDSYEKKDWRHLFNTVFGEEYYKDNKFKLEELSEILTENNRAKTTFVSPRTAVHAATLYCNGGSLEYISDIDKTVLAEYYKHNKDKEQDSADNELFQMIADYMAKNSLAENDSLEDMLTILLEENKRLTGEDMEIIRDKDYVVKKIEQLSYVSALINIHNWSKKNYEKSSNKNAEVKELIKTNSELLKK